MDGFIHKNYAEQLNQKETIVKDAMQRIAKIDIRMMETILSANPIFYYRNKLEYTFSNHKWIVDREAQEVDPTHALGFHRPESFFKIVDISKCHLQIDISNQIRNEIKALASNSNLAFYDIKDHKGLLRNLIIRTNHLDQVMMSLIIAADQENEVTDLLEAVKAKPIQSKLNTFMV